ncbi:aldo/keto reductase [Glaciihabitans sp. dw_435]|uniref:aldo/keto reductase n=1 Tax=Glaciihabitans sp. dw_435 TaxID=2720081 RepID=UPI001BD4C0BF|nr:aldo/keto reductase [Glaciihabitans sp. dw_435]
MTIPVVRLNDEHLLPAIGLGTYGLRGTAGVASILSGIDAGYRLLDTALNYENEREVGEAVRGSGIDRAEFVITTKLPGRFHGLEDTVAGFDESLGNLGLDYVDLYLIHWPLPKVNKYVDSWRAMIDLRESGLVRAIGVSNFTIDQLTRLEGETGVLPVVNQVELHPYFPQAELRAFHSEKGIQTESWSPLAARNALVTDATVGAIAREHGVTPAQVVLRWHVQLGSVPIPKSSNADRQRENADIFDFALSDEEIARISGLESGRLWAGDPDEHEEF